MIDYIHPRDNRVNIEVGALDARDCYRVSLAKLKLPSVTKGLLVVLVQRSCAMTISARDGRLLLIVSRKKGRSASRVKGCYGFADFLDLRFG